MYDLDLDPMTLILKFDIDMIKMYQHTKNEVSMSSASKVIAQTDKHTDTHTHTHLHHTTKTSPLQMEQVLQGIEMTVVLT